jgi:hypothetical protein
MRLLRLWDDLRAFEFLMPLVVYRARWRFWRHPLGGYNPIGWRSLEDIARPAGRRVQVSGFEVPGDGGGGAFMWIPGGDEDQGSGWIG